MIRQEGIAKKLTRAFIVQVLFFSAAVFIGIYVTNTIVQDSLLQEALDGEAKHFWSLFDLDPNQDVPNVNNLRGYLAKDTDFSSVPENLSEYLPGTHHIDVDGGQLTLHVTDHQEARLFLVFDSGHVSDLTFYFGVVPLSLALILIYGLSYLAYRSTQRAVSPIIQMADYFEGFDFDGDRSLTLNLEPIRAGANTEVEAMIDAIERFASRLAQFIERERIFTRDASHELRTPIAVFKGSLDLLERKSELYAQEGEIFTRMKRTVQDMESLIETLLLLAREEELKLPENPAPMNDAIAGSVDGLRSLAAKSHNTIRFNDISVLQVRAPERVVQILVTNLVRNSINYTQQGIIEVSVDNSSIRVVDTGVGMTSEDLENAFEPFFRAEKSRNMSSGHGLGLSIVRRLAHQFQWQINAESTPEKGTSVVVKFDSDNTLPISTS